MHWLAKLNIAGKLQLAPGLLIALLLLTAGAAYYGIAQQQALLDDIHDKRIQQYQQAITGVAYAQLLNRDTYSMALRVIETGDRVSGDVRGELLITARELQEHIHKSLDEGRLNAQEQDFYAQLNEEGGRLQQSLDKLLEIAATGDSHILLQQLTQTQGAFNGIDNLYANLLELQKELTEQAFVSATSSAALIRQALLILAVVSLLVAVGVSLLLSRQITGSIARIREGALHLCGGDLTQRVAVNGRDEIAQTASAFNSLIDSFQQALRQVVSGSDQLASSAYQLNQSANQIAGSSSQQAQTAASVASTVEQMTANIHSLAQNAQFVRNAAARSRDDSEAGVASLEQLRGELTQVQQASSSITASVNEFVRSTASISDMTSQVKAIAAQTNLLALNAAIEAARAGDQGRGFAVVAGEVRQLAELSSTTANNIDEVTQALAGQSAAVGKSLAAGAAAMASSHNQLAQLEKLFDSTRHSVDEVFHGIDGMAQAVEEQSLGSQEIARSVEHIANTAEASNDLCRDTFEATQQLRSLADSLQSTTSRFSV
ncbi:methyl-accepting chemotaxis protein [Stutzerimonas stutzeri]|uniref:methyl-accepting chemotaxis protein n=1 Tax=Stutzerimonas stutzeri TaxID=316 RepID=UPI0024472921|nr:methyl-accepting chemotaxis protein [Stutzerimonas stutzeri]MDH0426661.1 methyl-accepting chemotaxis protein [Stutzerimonas stutzeri]